MTETTDSAVNRRTILKGLAVAPAALAVPAVAAPAIISDASAVAASAVPVVEKYPWQWWAGHDEMLYEICSSREEAIAVAKTNGYPYITEAKQQDFDLSIDYDRLHECIWYSQNEERLNEDGELLDDVTPEQATDLENRLNAVIQQWIADHKIHTTAWAFGAQRNDEYVPEET